MSAKAKQPEVNDAHLAYGTPVDLHPATDRWMMGDQDGWVKCHNRDGTVSVRLRVSGKTLRFRREDVLTRADRERFTAELHAELG